MLLDCRFQYEELVLSRNLLLVPYDTDFNQEPCLKKGHRAHWALIIGKLSRKGVCSRGACIRTLKLGNLQVLFCVTRREDKQMKQ